MVYDPEKGPLSGIIDFGGMKVGDPAYDFWRPYSHYGGKALEALLFHYPRFGDYRRLRRKVEFFWTAQLVHRLARAARLGDGSNVACGAKILRSRLAMSLGR